MQCEKKLELRSHNTSYCLIEVATKAGFTEHNTQRWPFENRLTNHSKNCTFSAELFAL
jgi:hypothetical protein